jgi:uncharacterized protein with HEPN domain
MKIELAKYLLDALTACRAITSFTAGKSFSEYSSDLLLRSAVERQFEILGEAFNRIDNMDKSFRSKNPSLGSIIGMRNRIIHGYDSVDDNIVWDAVLKHIPTLKEWLESLNL